MPNLEVIPMELITIDAANVRTGDIPYDDPDLVHLTGSMRELGLLQPIIVRRDPEAGDVRYLVIAGKRRFLAARKLEWDTIKTVRITGDAARAEAISAAENMARAAMHPVDEWRAVESVVGRNGWDINRAARTLGIDETHIPRMRQLAKMAPAMLDAIKASRPAPPMAQIRIISLADHETQEAALKAHGRDGALFWNRITEGCMTRRIRHSAALFDPVTEGVVFEEDMFAEPDAPDRFTTTDVAGFLKAQRRVIDDRIMKTGGHGELIDLMPGEHAHAAIPKGWTWAAGEIPKRWKKSDPRKVFAFLNTAGLRVGEVTWLLCEPEPERPSKPAKAPGTPPINAATWDKLAKMQDEAVRESLSGRRLYGTAGMLYVLLLTFLFDNVNVVGAGHATMELVRRTLLDSRGNPQPMNEEELCTMAAAVAGSALIFRAPGRPDASGEGAHLLAQAIGAVMPRCDTADILEGVSGAELRRLAELAGIDARGTVTAVRGRLVGNLADWRPVDFYTPAAASLSGISEGEADDGQ